MKSRTWLMIGITIVLIIALFASPVAAKHASGDVTYSAHEQTSTTETSVSVEKQVHVEMEGNACVEDSTSGPLSGTSGDGRIEVSVDSDISARGRTSGTGTAVLDGSVQAEGSHDGAGNVVINTSVSSSVVLDSGTKGKAEGCVETEGTATATYNETEMVSSVQGTTSASGSAQSGSVGYLEASGEIFSESSSVGGNLTAETLIESEVLGGNKASGFASASGNASALADSGNVTASVIGSTWASGSGKGSGLFGAESGIYAESQRGLAEWGYVETSITSGSSVESDCGKYKATASSSASTPEGEENRAYYGGESMVPSILAQLYEDARTTGTASSKASICDSTGIALGLSGIEAFAATPGLEMYYVGFGPESVYIGADFDPAYADGSDLWNYAYAEGSDKKSKVSAEGSTKGAANSSLNYSIEYTTGELLIQRSITSNTSADGETSSKVNVQGFGSAEAESQIGSLDLIGVGGGYIGIEVNLVPGDAQLPQLPDLPETENPLLQDDLLQQESLVPDFPMESVSLIEGFEVPSIDVLEISLISQSVSATNYDKGKAFADACAKGDTAADGKDLALETYDTDPLQPISIIGSSSADGFVKGSAEAGATCDHDPASASIILGVSAQGIGFTPDYTDSSIQNNNAPAGLDATLIASFSGAGGSSGRTWGTARGSADAAGGFTPIAAQSFDGPSSSNGTVNTAATANGGLGLSAAAIGSADYATDDGLTGSLVDVALIGTGSFAAGTAGAHGDADGRTEANGSILHLYEIEIDEYIDVLNITSSAYADGRACSDVSTKNGIALAADVLLAGEGTGATEIVGAGAGEVGITQDGDTGGGIGGSTISQLAFAQQFGKSGSAKADAFAEGEAGTDSSFYVDLLPGYAEPPVYISGDGVTGALGEVKGSANAGCGDPLSVSTIMAFTEFGGGGSLFYDEKLGRYEFIGDGEAYDATLIGSLSASWGKSADTWGIADGIAVADSHLEVNTTSENPDSLYQWNSTSTADAKVKTTASTSGPDGFALALAAQGSSSEVEAELVVDGGSAEEHAITLDGALSVAAGDGKATADVNKMELFRTDKKGKVTEVTCIPILTREATALAQFTGDTDNDQVVDVNITSSSVSGSTASTSAEAKKGGFALSLAGEASGALTDLNATGEAPVADQDVFSVIADLAIAETDCSKETAKAAASAEGDTSAFSYGEISDWNSTQSSAAQGSVSGGAIAGDTCKDPLSASVILGLTDMALTAEGGEAHNTALIASLSASSGTSGNTWGSADGTAFSGSSLELNASDDLYNWESSSSADALVKTTASTTSPGGFALGVAAQGALTEGEVTIDGVDRGEGSTIALDGALSVAAGDGKAGALVNMEEQVQLVKCGRKTTQVIELVPIEGREAAAFAQFTADLDGDLEPEGNFTSSSVSGSYAITSAEAAKGGFGFGLAGEASGSLTEVNATAGTIDQDVFSVIAGIAAAETDAKKETAKANAAAGGTTTAFNYGEIPGWNGTQASSASGNVSDWAVASDSCKDPLSASLILALGENEAYPDPDFAALPAMDSSDMTLIASFSVTNGTKGETGGLADGSASAEGVQLYPNYLGTPMSPTSNSSTEASVWSHAESNNGLGLGVAGVGSESFAHAGYNNHNISDENLMFSYTTAQGFGKKATAEACAGYDATDTSASASNVYDRDLNIAKAASNSSAAGIGESYTKAKDTSMAEALTFGWAKQNASIDFVGYEAHAFAVTIFGTEANATNDAKGTLAKAEMSQVNLDASARAGFAPFSITEEYATAKVIDGSSHIFLDPYLYNGDVDWDSVFTGTASVSSGGSAIPQGYAEGGSLADDPNWWYTHGGVWANSDVGTAPDPWPPHEMILSYIP